MSNREFVFTIKEIKKKYNPNYHDNVEHFIYARTGTVSVIDGEIHVMIDDSKQPNGMFETNDGFFKKIISKIHNVTK